MSVDYLAELKKVRKNYREISAALPWLDCYISDYPVPFEDAPLRPTTEYVELSYTEGSPRLIKQTDYTFEQIEAMAKAEPNTAFIIAAGNRKLLYHVEAIEDLLKRYPNIYVCTAALCLPMILEEYVKKGLSKKLLYGSMMPYLDAGQAMCPVALGAFDWETKCAIAGNNLRTLLGKPAVLPPEVPLVHAEPFIIDAHIHTKNPETPSRFPAPNSDPNWSSWKPTMDFFWMDKMFNTAGEAIADVRQYTSRGLTDKMSDDSKGRVLFFEFYDPRYIPESLAALEKALPDPRCIGIKIHPVENHVFANDPTYEDVYKMAEKYNKPIMSHTWGLSDYNPNQKYGCPELFECWLKKYPKVHFVFGHTGGRPNGYVNAVKMAKEFPTTTCFDLAGDFFSNGFIPHALKEIGADRMLFASDIYWIDIRCMLGMLMNSPATDEELLQICRKNAERVYLHK